MVAVNLRSLKPSQAGAFANSLAHGARKGVNVIIGRVPVIGRPRYADVYFRSGKFYVSARHQTTAGFYQLGDPTLAVDLVDGPAKLGMATLDALAGSQEMMPVDVEKRNELPPVVALAGARSWAQFVRGAQHVAVMRHGTELLLGRDAVEAHSFASRIDSVTPEAVGTAIAQMVD